MIKLVLSVVAFFVIVFALGNYELFNREYFGTRSRAIENRIFKESEQYNDGVIRDLYDLKIEYMNGNDEKKESIRSLIQHRFSVYPKEKLPSDLIAFLNEIGV